MKDSWKYKSQPYTAGGSDEGHQITKIWNYQYNYTGTDHQHQPHYILQQNHVMLHLVSSIKSSREI